MTDTKQCSKCKQVKLVSAFYKNRSSSDRLQGWCKTCLNAAARAYEQTEKGKETQRRRIRKCHLANPNKRKARKAVWSAVARGELPPAKDCKCVHCGNQAERYHHFLGYEPEHWLDVISLCQSCDHKAHKNMAS